MLKMVILVAPILFLCSSVLGQESVQIFTLHRHDSSSVAQTMGVSVDVERLNEVYSSVLMAEKWLRTHVLSYYPSSNINSIVVGNDLLCRHKSFNNREEMARLALYSMKNIHHSLTRWGLEREIKVSVSLSSNCLQSHQSHLKPVFEFLETINSTFTINPHQFSDETAGMLISQLKSMNDLGVFQSETVNVILPVSKQAKPTSRKLSFIEPLPPAASPPFIGASSPTPFSPEIQPPMMGPASSPFNLPPCNPHHADPPAVGIGGGPVAAPAMSGGGYGQEGLWCVAKPSVPSEKLQVAMDYACGAGGADCAPISPSGSCYSPDSVVAHASYAFNSYWQKNKKNGGVCGFEGTAMLISSDPSFLHCHFILA